MITENCKMGDTLFRVLNDFRGVTDVADEKQKLAALSLQFAIIAKVVICGGCFEIDGKRRIYPLEVEFYYHEEEENGLKDPVMYHTDDHDGRKLEYFPLGSLNCHVSGIDITFENKEKRYRASFLIRKYKVCKYDGEMWQVDKECESRSTYIYEDMFMHIPLFNGINVKWISVDSPDCNHKIIVNPRINVAEYEKNNEGKFVKVEITKEDYNKLSSNEKKEYFSYCGKRLKRCKRMWNYSIVNY